MHAQSVTSLVKLVLPADSTLTYFTYDEKTYQVRWVATSWVVEDADAPNELVAVLERTAVGWRASSPDRGYEVDDDLLFLAVADVLGVRSSTYRSSQDDCASA